MNRVLEQEWLDELPADDPGAQQSRGDLQRVNVLMGHARLMARALRGVSAPKRVCDLGAGDGTFPLALARRLQWRDLEIVLVDRQSLLAPETAQAFEDHRCSISILAEDVFTALERSIRYDIIIANLFLHHFAADALRQLLPRIAGRTRCFAACEPRRARLPLLASRCLALVGCNRVTRHDAVLSVRAGFRGNELGNLWPREGWRLSESSAGLFTHLFAASRQ